MHGPLLSHPQPVLVVVQLCEVGALVNQPQVHLQVQSLASAGTAQMMTKMSTRWKNGFMARSLKDAGV